MPSQTYYETFSITAPSNGEYTEVGLTHLDSAKRVMNRIYADAVANVSIVVYADQLKVMEFDSQHFPSDGEGIELEIDLSTYATITVGISNNTGGAHTHNVSIRYTQG